MSHPQPHRSNCPPEPRVARNRRLSGLSIGMIPFLTLSLLAAVLTARSADDYAAPSALEQGWEQPPLSARTRAYWWWLNGNLTKESITRDLEGMRAKGWGGALICDAGGADQDGNDRVPHGPTFFSPEWRDLYRYALREADRLGLEMSLNIQSGWNLGGPIVSVDDAAKKLVWSELVVPGPADFSAALPSPRVRDNYLRDVAVLAYRLRDDLPVNRSPIRNWREKSIHNALHFSAPETDFLLEDAAGLPDEQDARTGEVIDLTEKLGPDGVLRWSVPAGRWQILRFAHTIGDRSYVSTSSDAWKGYALDVLDAAAFKRYWDAVVEPLIADAGPLAGRTLKYLHTDSWEVEPLNWTPRLREKFRRYRGYDLLPWMPVLAGRIINSREESNRFLNDFRKTLGDLAVDEHYAPFRAWAHRHGLEIHPESGGPHAVPIDAQRCLGQNDVPMSEFWAWSWRHRLGDTNRFFVKQPASAAHTYGHNMVAAEGFTTIGPHWQETIWDNLKPAFDHACTEGLNRLVWHAVVSSPKEMGLPGQQYFAGTHFNPNTTWWEKSGPFLAYLNRCQFMLQRGLFVADALCYYGDHVPNFARLRSSDPAGVGPGYDYDVITEDAILTRLAVKDGRLTLPDGMSYRLLVLPNRTSISLPVLEKVRQLVIDGATVILPRPQKASGLARFPECDGQVERIADQLFGELIVTGPGRRNVGRGRVITGRTAREVLLADAVKPDFESAGGDAASEINYLHRQDGATHIYFVASRAKRPESIRATFRVSGQAPELWNPVSGERGYAADYDERDGRIVLPLEFPPCGSWFVVFRHPASSHPPRRQGNPAGFTAIQELHGPWTVGFDPKWGGPESIQFEKLVSWTERPEPGIRFYSGTAVYRRQFDAPAAAAAKSLWLDLGEVRELAEVKVNGRSCGVAWAPPFRVNLSPALKPGSNLLEIEVVNFWANRVIGDEALPADQRLTRTNIRRLTRDTSLMPSGLFGPVRLMTANAEEPPGSIR